MTYSQMLALADDRLSHAADLERDGLAAASLAYRMSAERLRAAVRKAANVPGTYLRIRGEGDAHRPERCQTCGCELAYPAAVHLLDCKEGDAHAE